MNEDHRNNHKKNDNENKRSHLKRRSAKSYYDMIVPTTTHKKRSFPRKQTTTATAAIELYESFQGLDEHTLPETYHTTYITLVPKNPFMLYAYWEINGGDVAVLRDQIGESIDSAVYTLRVYDVTFVDFDGTNANYWFDLDELHMQHRYIDVWSDDADFIAEVGLRCVSGEFYPLSRSNVAKTPRAGMSQRSDLIWKEMEDKKLSGKIYVNLGLFNRSKRGALKPRTNWQQNLRQISISQKYLETYYNKNTSLLNLFLNSSVGHQDVIQKVLTSGQVTLENSIVPEIMKEMVVKRNKLGSSDEFLSQQRKKLTFPFELDMTLIVRGKTEPGANVFLGNKKIDLNTDGTFTLKWELQDGVLPLDFKAQSPTKGLSKSISTKVIRSYTNEEPS